MPTQSDLLVKGLNGRLDTQQRQLAAFAVHAEDSRGRLIPESECPMRGPYQRDRDRIVHASAFRRLTYKTQVFIAHEGDHYRSRLTHSLEVAQIARAIARMLQLDEDLAEALALAHDLGHPPFGHAGERALAAAMTDYGGFDHNAQSLKLVTALELRYAAFDGLNLTWETLEGLVKHNGPLTGPAAGGSAKEASLPAAIAEYDALQPLELSLFASAEAQCAAIADDVAYNNHDIDDGLRAGLITLDDLRDVPLAKRFIDEVTTRHGTLSQPRHIYEVNRRMITHMVDDIVSEARRRLSHLAPRNATAIRQAEHPVVTFSAAMHRELEKLRAFLFQHVYRHERVMRVMTRAEQVVQDLFAHYLETPDDLPERWRAQDAAPSRRAQAQLIADFVAGMTDRFALQEHNRLFDGALELR